MIKIHNLRLAGFKVNINHRRRYFDKANKRYVFLTDYEKSLSPLVGVPPEQKGGRTEIKLIDVDGKEVYAVAECSKKEAYNKKTGVQIAVGRALKSMNL